MFAKIKNIMSAHPPGDRGTRNDLMVEEVRRFAQEVKTFQAQFLELSKQTQDRLGLVAAMLDKPLPRVYDQSPGGAAPAESSQRIGLNVQSAGIESARNELDNRLQQDVMVNLTRWIDDYRTIKGEHRDNLKRLSALNDQRSKTQSLHDKASKQMMQNHKDADLTQSKAHQEEGRLSDMQAEYVLYEQKVYEELVKLVRRSALFKDGIAMSFGIFHSTFGAVYSAFESAHASQAGQLRPASGSGAPYTVCEPTEALPVRPAAVSALPSTTTAHHVDTTPQVYGQGPTASASSNPYNSANDYTSPAINPYAPPTAATEPRTSATGAQPAPPYPAAPTTAAPAPYPTMYAPVQQGPSAQEQGSTAWVDNASAGAAAPRVT